MSGATTTSAATATATKPVPSLSEQLSKAAKAALGGGLPGAAAMAVQVGTLMWLRTTMNYQYRYGTTTMQALRTLWAQGGVPRFYQGLLPALVQGPLSRFGDTAANSGMLALLDGNESTRNLPVSLKTAAASVTAGLFRIGLMPVDAVKTIMQVEGKHGLPALLAKIRVGGPQVLFHGSLASAGATMVGHFPWFYTFNTLQSIIPRETELWRKLARNAVIGFVSSVVSDSISNSLRIIKTTKQTSTTAISYPAATRMIIEKDGITGLLGRGLKTRLITNGLQGLMFSVVWRALEDMWNNKPPQ